MLFRSNRPVPFRGNQGHRLPQEGHAGMLLDGLTIALLHQRCQGREFQGRRVSRDVTHTPCDAIAVTVTLRTNLT